MDPLSVSASLIGVIGAASTIARLVATLVTGITQAPVLARDVLLEVSAVRSCLTQLQSLLSDTSQVSRSHSSIIMIEEVVVVLASCVTTFSELEELVDGIRDTQNMNILDKVKWSRKEHSITTIFPRLQASKTSLNLILTILTNSSLEEARSSISELSDMVSQILKTNQEMCRRLEAMEVQQSKISMRARAISTNHQRNSLSTVGARTSLESQRENEIIQPTQYGFTFDPILQQTRVYARNTFHHSVSSLPLSANRTTRSSFFAGISLSDVSNVSVLSLPLVAHGLYNRQRYFPKFQEFMIPRPGGIEHNLGRRNVLFLGPGESGKSTIYEHFRLFFPTHTLYDCAKVARQQVVDSFNQVLSLIEDLMECSDGDEYEIAAFFNVTVKFGISSVNSHLSYAASMFEALWKNKFLNEATMRELRAKLNESSLYFLDSAVRITNKGYVPTKEDILRCKITKSIGINRSSFRSVKANFDLIDASVGGSMQQRCARVFDGADCVIYVVNSAGYDIPLKEDPVTSQMIEALMLFQSILYLPWLKSAQLILCFNKTDELQKKLATSPISQYFPDYQGGDDYTLALDYFKRRFLDLAQQDCLKRIRSIQCINAFDTDSFQSLLRDVMDVVMYESEKVSLVTDKPVYPTAPALSILPTEIIPPPRGMTIVQGIIAAIL